MIARQSRPATLVILLLIILAGCTGTGQPMVTPAATNGLSPAAPGTPTETTANIPLKVGMAPYLSYAPFYIAAAEGYFKEQGLNVELVRIARASDAVVSLAQGQLDVVGSLINSSLLNAMVRDSGIKIVASKERLIEQACVYSGFVARKDSALSGSDKITPELLKGLRYDVNPTNLSGYMLDTLLQKYGLSLDKITLADMPNAAAGLDAMRQGTVDVASMSEPWITQARLAGAGDVWLGRGKLAPDNQGAIVAYGPTLLKNNPEAGERFMVAYLKGVRRFAAGLTEPTLALLEKELELDRTLLTQMCLPYIPLDGEINAQSIIDFGNWAAAQGYIDAPVTTEMFWEPRFVEYARQALGTP